MDYRDLSGKFDRIVSVGMMEHVGPKNLETFFDKCISLLEPDGMMLHHTIASNINSARPRLASGPRAGLRPVPFELPQLRARALADRARVTAAG
jgi:cyclopropane fatty-acyl-phospholipid synthase-like methyltransferase